MFTPSHSQYVKINGLRFHYLDHGNAGAPPLVLLHGFTSHAHSWDTFAASVRDHFHVLALDQRGHGESDWAADYSREAQVDDVAAFARALRLDKFTLLGLSMGGMNAYTYAAKYPQTLERMVIVDIGPELLPAGGARIRTGTQSRDVWDTPEEAFQQYRAANTRAPEAELLSRIAHNLMRTEDGRWTYMYDKALRAPDRVPARPDPEAGYAMLATIPSPTLLVRGAESDLLGAEAADKMTTVMPNCQLVSVPRAGHSVNLDNPQGFIDAVKPWLLAGLG
ncbi:MAG: alpha/beta hydrolase [Chloroflexi bacterium]|nr:alpha/beta hydrolase [Chloroflexota bacterium]